LWIVPVLALGRALYRDADVAFGDRSRAILGHDARRHFGRIDAEDVARGAMQADMAKVARLTHAVHVIEE
jgi:hypothetical protein